MTLRLNQSIYSFSPLILAGTLWASIGLACNESTHLKAYFELKQKFDGISAKVNRDMGDELALQEIASALLEVQVRSEYSLIEEIKIKFNYERQTLLERHRKSLENIAAKQKALEDSLSKITETIEDLGQIKKMNCKKESREACGFSWFSSENSASKEKENQNILEKIREEQAKENKIRLKLEALQTEEQRVEKQYASWVADSFQRELAITQKHMKCIEEATFASQITLSKSKARVSQLTQKHLDVDTRWVNEVEGRLIQQERVLTDLTHRLQAPTNPASSASAMGSKADLEIEEILNRYPKAIIYYNEIYKRVYVSILTYLCLSTGKLARAPTFTDYAGLGIATAIRIVPAAEPVALLTQTGVTAAKDYAQMNRAKHVYDTLNPKAVEEVPEIVAIELTRRFAAELEPLDKDDVLKKANQTAKMIYHTVTAGEVFKHFNLSERHVRSREIGAFLIDKVVDFYSKTDFLTKKPKKWGVFKRIYGLDSRSINRTGAGPLK